MKLTGHGAATLKVDTETGNWTTMPANWDALRMQWEYSHAASAALNLAALVALILCILAAPKPRQ